MHVDTMRWIDREIGNPLCRLMSPLTSLFERPPSGNTVVVAKFFGIGSLLLSFPLVTELKRAGHEVVFLTFAGHRETARDLGVDEVLMIDPRSLWGFLLSTLRAVSRLRRLRPAAFLNLEFFSRYGALLCAFSGSPLRAGFHMVHLPIGRLYTARVNLNVYRSVYENFLHLGAASGLIQSESPFATYVEAFPAPDPDVPLPDGVKPPFILLSPESSDTVADLKSWPVSHWAKLIDALAARYPGHALVLDGTKKSRALADDIRSKLSRPEVLEVVVGETSLAQLQSMIRAADLTITVDSAPLHFAALFKRPVIAMFGPETPVLFGHDLPWVQTIYEGIACSPCTAIYDARVSVLDCRDNQCMKRIHPEEVVGRAAELLEPSAERAAE